MHIEGSFLSKLNGLKSKIAIELSNRFFLYSEQLGLTESAYLVKL